MHLNSRRFLHIPTRLPLAVFGSPILIGGLLLAGCSSTPQDGHLPPKVTSSSISMPAAGKSKVVFLRPSSDGHVVDFGIHDGDRLIGRSVSSTYFTYECDPGHHVFSSSFGNMMILKADLLPDRIYYVNVRGQLRAFGPVWVRMEPVYPGGASIQWEKLPRIIEDLKENRVTNAEVEHDLTGIEKYKERMRKSENDPESQASLLPEHGQAAHL